ncbi:transcriptional regulator family: Fungal Specific TF [Trichoderma aggressivum f. europaeum]|uniref:Transcriptional regulator family: Fungal Specific TF n=1 Tax=Trichoderma aggressivum f. europaeum TaxID=173218 RepID=A0AAE1LV72_9HYPO|nr:transcriptional regulator family: Fungal Specific TF [Trichoderma aggressivum f. europaeum]
MIHNTLQRVDEDNDDMLHQPPIIPRPPVPRPARSSSGGSTVHTSPATTASSSVIKLQFINTAHPSESTSAKRISQIRSHVAKDSHARRRQRKAGKACCSSSASASATATATATAASAVAADSPARTESPGSDSTSTNAVALPVRARLDVGGKEGMLVSSRGFRRIAPKTGALDRNAEVPCPRKLIGDARRDGWNGAFAWELTDDEYATFNFYLDWVLKYGYEICFPRDQVAPVMKRMKSSFVPFAIKYPSLLACIFYIAYHRRALNSKDPEEVAKCNLKVERYRLACIEMMKKAIEGEERPTYQTITLAMQLCSEAYFEGHTDVSFTHAHAARTMVSARGGLESFENVGIYGLISFLLATSVYSGNYWFVPGCARAPED